MELISLDSAMVVTGLSKRTFWRRIEDGQIARHTDDSRGRAMISVRDIASIICIPVEPEDLELFSEADSGDADAQNDLAQLFLEAGRPDVAIYWLEAAVTQQHADATHHLAMLYIRGTHVEKDERQGLMWLSKAAVLGHKIAEQQISALMSKAPNLK